MKYLKHEQINNLVKKKDGPENWEAQFHNIQYTVPSESTGIAKVLEVQF